MSKWFPGSDEFSPAKCAASILDGVRPSADESHRQTIVGMWRYYTGYLRATAHRNPNLAGQQEDGTPAWYSWQASTMARYYIQVYGMARGYWDDDEYERQSARESWKAADWDAMWDEIAADERRATP